MKFLPEKPADVDLLDGQSHELVAKTISNELSSDSEAYIIGLDGDLGSGKSTVVERLKEHVKGSESQILFVDFDVELYHNNNVNKALINTIYEELISHSWFPTSEQKKLITNIKNRALGKIIEYERNITSKFSSWAVAFALIVLFISELTGDIINALVSTISTLPNVFEISSWQFNLHHSLVLFIPVFVLFIYKVLFNRMVKDENGNSLSVLSVFDKKIPETIKDVFDVTNDIGSYELNNALKEFIEIIPKDGVVVLVIDNLDRVPSQAFSQVWSDLEVFTHRTAQNFRLLIPFSSRHVASAIVTDPEEPSNSSIKNFNAGQEFISKRIPVLFRVSSSVTADWHRLLEQFLNLAEIRVTEEDIKSVIRLTHIWAYKDDLILTPRFLKYKVNEVVSILKIHNGSEGVNPLFAWAYVNIMQYRDFNIDILLGLNNDLQSEDIEIVKFKTSIDILTLRGHSALNIFEAFAKIHFQTTDGQIALSELLEKDISSSFKERNLIRLFNSDRYHYDNALYNFAVSEDRVSIMQFLIEVYSTNENDDIIQKFKGWFNNYFLRIIRPLFLQGKEKILDLKYYTGIAEADVKLFVDSIDFINALYPLMDELNLLDSEIESFSNSMNERLIEFISENDVVNESLSSVPLIKRVYILSGLVGYEFEQSPLVIAPVSFLYYAWMNQSEYSNWKVHFDIDSPENFSKLLAALSENDSLIEEKGEEIRQGIRVKHRLGDFPLFKDDVKNGNILESIEASNSDNFVFELISRPERLIFSQNYISGDQNFYDQLSLYNSINIKWNEKSVAVAICYALRMKDYAGADNLVVKAQSNEIFNQKVFDSYLLVVPLFQMIMKPIQDNFTNIKSVLEKSVESLIRRRRVSKLITNDLFTDYYQYLKPLFLDDLEVLFNWMDSWGMHLKSTEEVEENIFEDLSNSGENSLSNTIIKLCNKRAENLDWSEAIINPSTLDHQENKLYLFVGESRARYAAFANSLNTILSEAPQQLPDVTYVKRTLATLKPTGRRRVVNDFNKLWLNVDTPFSIREWLTLHFSQHLTFKNKHNKSLQLLILDVLENSGEIEVIKYLCNLVDSKVNSWSLVNRERLSRIILANDYADYFVKFEITEN